MLSVSKQHQERPRHGLQPLKQARQTCAPSFISAILSPYRKRIQESVKTEDVLPRKVEKNAGVCHMNSRETDGKANGFTLLSPPSSEAQLFTRAMKRQMTIAMPSELRRTEQGKLTMLWLQESTAQCRAGTTSHHCRPCL